MAEATLADGSVVRGAQGGEIRRNAPPAHSRVAAQPAFSASDPEIVISSIRMWGALVVPFQRMSFRHIAASETPRARPRASQIGDSSTSRKWGT